MDLCAVERAVLLPGAARAVPTGLAIELPPGFEAQVRPRSGMALKHSVTVNFGTIDPGYRGEIRVIMFNLGRADYAIEKGDRIAQLIVARYQSIEWEEGELGDSARGERLGAVSREGGCHSCHTHQSCQSLCPQGLNPTRSIAALKRLSVAALLKGGLAP